MSPGAAHAREHVVVIGAGVGGLAVAVGLAAAGLQVTVFERADVVGGKLGWQRAGGFGFDTGPSLLILPALLTDLLERTGGIPDTLRLSRLDPLMRYEFADGSRVDLPAGTGPDVGAALDRALGAGTGRQWLDLLAYGRRVWQATAGPFLSRPVTGAATLARLAARHPADLPLVAPWRTLDQVARRRLADPRLRMMLRRYATYSGSDPARAPAALAAIPWVEADGGGWYVQGGLRRIADVLADRARSLGVQIRTGVEVTRVLVEQGAAAGVELAEEGRVSAAAVVANTDASQLYRRLVADRRAHAPARRLARATRSYSGFALLLAVRGEADGSPSHTVRFPADYAAEFRDLAAGRPARDPALYLHRPADPSLAPAGHSSWFALVNAPRHQPAGGTDWQSDHLAERYAETLLRRLELGSRLVSCQVRTPADLERETGSPGGAIYGSSSDGATAAFLRPANRSPLPGLFLVGGSAHPGGGLPLVLLGARIVEGLVTGTRPAPLTL